MKKINIICILSTFVLFGCGGGADNKKDPNRYIEIDAYGESSFTGYGLPEGESIPMYVQNKIKNSKVNNRAVNGTTTRQQLEGTDGFNSPFDQQIKLSRAEFLLLNRGGNEAFRNITPDQFKNDLYMVINIAQRNGKKVILQTPTILCNDPLISQNAKNISEIVRVVAKEFNLPYSDAEKISLVEGCINLPDKIHANQKLAKILGEDLANILQKEIDKDV